MASKYFSADIIAVFVGRLRHVAAALIHRWLVDISLERDTNLTLDEMRLDMTFSEDLQRLFTSG